MEEREQQVYLARLAEQAERYDGTLSSFHTLIVPISPSLNLCFFIFIYFFYSFFFLKGIYFLVAVLEVIFRWFLLVI